jgi:two-component system sensor histidine kinase VanS
VPPEQKAKYVGITLEKAYRLEQLINEFFEITRFNLQTIVLNKEKINLLFMLQQMADEFYPMLTPQGKRCQSMCLTVSLCGEMQTNWLVCSITF